MEWRAFRALTRRDELLEPDGQRQDGEQAKRLEEHEDVEEEETDGQADVRERPRQAAVRPKRAAQIRQASHVHDKELGGECSCRHQCPLVIFRFVQQDDDGDIGDDVRKEEEDADEENEEDAY